MVCRHLTALAWFCCTGTPLQNRIGELFSLVRFLQLEKYAFYHCNMCDCQMLDYKYVRRRARNLCCI
jgi:DNA repair protein RAD16